MRFLLFPRADFTSITTGERHVDIRLHEPNVHDMLQGELFTAVFGEGDGQTEQVEMIAYRSAQVIKASELNDSEAQAAGYKSAHEFRQRLMQNDPSVTEDSTIVVNRFEVDRRSFQTPQSKPAIVRR